MDKEFRHELFLTTRQATKIKNVFTNNMSTDIKVSKAQISGFVRNMSDNLGKNVITDLAIPLAKGNSPG